MKNLFSIGINLDNCSADDLNNVIALFLNEDVDNIDLFGYNIYFAKVKEYHDTRNFGEFFPRRIIARNSSNDVVTDMVISSDMTKELKASITAQLVSQHRL